MPGRFFDKLKDPKVLSALAGLGLIVAPPAAEAVGLNRVDDDTDRTTETTPAIESEVDSWVLRQVADQRTLEAAIRESDDFFRRRGIKDTSFLFGPPPKNASTPVGDLVGGAFKEVNMDDPAAQGPVAPAVVGESPLSAFLDGDEEGAKDTLVSFTTKPTDVSSERAVNANAARSVGVEEGTQMETLTTVSTINRADTYLWNDPSSNSTHDFSLGNEQVVVVEPGVDGQSVVVDSNGVSFTRVRVVVDGVDQIGWVKSDRIQATESLTLAEADPAALLSLGIWQDGTTLRNLPDGVSVGAFDENGSLVQIYNSKTKEVVAVTSASAEQLSGLPAEAALLIIARHPEWTIQTVGETNTTLVFSGEQAIGVITAESGRFRLATDVIDEISSSPEFSQIASVDAVDAFMAGHPEMVIVSKVDAYAIWRISDVSRIPERNAQLSRILLVDGVRMEQESQFIGRDFIAWTENGRPIRLIIDEEFPPIEVSGRQVSTGNDEKGNMIQMLSDFPPGLMAVFEWGGMPASQFPTEPVFSSYEEQLQYGDNALQTFIDIPGWPPADQAQIALRKLTSAIDEGRLRRNEDGTLSVVEGAPVDPALSPYIEGWKLKTGDGWDTYHGSGGITFHLSEVSSRDEMRGTDFGEGYSLTPEVDDADNLILNGDVLPELVANPNSLTGSYVGDLSLLEVIFGRALIIPASPHAVKFGDQPLTEEDMSLAQGDLGDELRQFSVVYGGVGGRESYNLGAQYGTNGTWIRFQNR